MKIGKRIQELRQLYGMTQQELADRCELTKGYISQLERDLTSPSIATLVDILQCLGTELGPFFTEAAPEKAVFHQDEVFVKEEPDAGRTIHWIVPNAQKNEMEPILLTLQPGASTDKDFPHEGEEFGYVLSGAVQVNLGSQGHRAKKGEAFYYKADRVHYLRNVGKSPCRLLWVSTPPMF